MDNKIDRFVNTLLKTNRTFDFFVNLENIEYYKNFEIELNALNFLIGKIDFYEAFSKLLNSLPSVVKTFPLLLAISKIERENLIKNNNNLSILNINEFNIEEFDFESSNLNQEKIDKYYLFFKETGLKTIFQNYLNKSVLDYAIGILVGLDTNGRKNRSGLIFENLCDEIIQNICDKYKIKKFSQKQFKNVFKNESIKISNWNIQEKKADFILIKNNKVLNIECNFYNESGSKPEEIVESYINRVNDLAKSQIEFILITDGYCWKNETKTQLLKAFKNFDILNYCLSKNGELESLILEKLDLK